MQNKPRLLADTSLLFVSMVWGSAFVVQRIVAVEIGVFLFNGMRFLLGALVLVPFAVFRNRKEAISKVNPLWRFIWVALSGCLLALGAGFQQAGLMFTTAANAGFITGLYVIFIPFLMSIIWRENIEARIWLAAILATLGLFLLSTGGSMQLNPGDALELIGALIWALHFILLGYLAGRMDVVFLAAGQFMVCGLLSLGIGMILEPEAWGSLLSGLWAVIYTGVFSVGLGYTLQVAAQRHAPPPDAAILLSLEAVFAALMGWWFIGEGLNLVQIAGCAVILTGTLLAQARAFARRDIRP